MMGKDTSSQNDPLLQVQKTEYSVVREVQDAFGNHIIRRTSSFKRYDGKAINEQLGMYKTYVVTPKLPPSEMEDLEDQAEEYRDMGGSERAHQVSASTILARLFTQGDYRLSSSRCASTSHAQQLMGHILPSQHKKNGKPTLVANFKH